MCGARRLRHSGCLALLLLLAPQAVREAVAQPAADWNRCRAAIAAAEAEGGIPPGLLGAIALVESGRRNPATGSVEPWPWSYNAAGEGYVPRSKAEAMAAVSALQANGVRSIDIGCMQVNLMHHPKAFGSLEEAFDPQANLRYATRFLQDLFRRTGDWGQAIARYHSGEAERGAAYNRRVALARMGTAWVQGGGVPLPPRIAPDFCRVGYTPMLLFGGPQEARRFMTPQARRAGRVAPVPPARSHPRLLCIRAAAPR
jgi:soluble lytic murein transglycosylase-like protein